MIRFSLAAIADSVESEVHSDAIETKPVVKRADTILRRVLLLQKGRARCAFAPLQVALCAAIALTTPCAIAQTVLAPPAVGVVKVERRPTIESDTFNGRIEPLISVKIAARITAFVEKKSFAEGSEVKRGDVLYTLERAPFQATVDVQKAAVAQAEAQLENSNTELWRKQQLLQKNAGTQEAVDNAQATQRVAAAQLKSAQAQLEVSQINLDYTEIRSPIDGRIGVALVSVGNVVGPTSGTMTTIVSQDPMDVVFSVPTRRAIELREQYAAKGGLDALEIRVRLPNGKLYGQIGKLDLVNHTIADDTDTLLLRAVIPNPVLGSEKVGGARLRELQAGEFVTVLLESVEPRQIVTVPRAALLADQQGNYVYVVDEQSVVRQRRVRIGQSMPETAGIVDGLAEGESIVVEGIQRVRPNMPVSPAPVPSSFAGRK
jgi:membrane fusion protein (multidrug efflux system)